MNEAVDRPTGKSTDIFRFYEARAEFAQSSQAFFQLTATQVQALSTYPNLLTVSVNPDMPFRTIWGYVMSDLSQTVNIQDTDLIATLDGMTVYTQKLGRITTVVGNYVTLPFFYGGMAGLDSAQRGIAGEPIRIQPGSTGAQFYIYPIRLNMTCDTLYIRVNTLTDAGLAKYDGRLMVKSQRGI